MHVTYRCPQCDQVARSEPLTAEQTMLTCSACHWHRAVPGEAIEQNCPHNCLVCGNEDLWRQKDFPQSWGVACVALGAILSSIAWYYHRPITALSILMAFALLDMVLYIIMPDVLVCYRCGARHSNADTSRHANFDHELSERYRQEAIRMNRASR